MGSIGVSYGVPGIRSVSILLPSDSEVLHKCADDLDIAPVLLEILDGMHHSDALQLPLVRYAEKSSTGLRSALDDKWVIKPTIDCWNTPNTSTLCRG